MKQPKLTTAQKQVLHFAQFPYDTDYIFYYKGSSQGANKFIQRMRTELSRMRRIIKDKGQSIIPFKMIIKEVEEVDGPILHNKRKIADIGHTRVVLVRVLPHDDATEEVQEIFGPLMTEISRRQIGIK